MHTPTSRPSLLNAGSIALLYASVGILWILFSDWLLFREGFLGTTPVWWVQAAKGQFYVAFTALGLYLLVKRLTARITRNAELLERVVNHLPETVAVLNEEGGIVYANASAKEPWFSDALWQLRHKVTEREVRVNNRVFVHGKAPLGDTGLSLVHMRDVSEEDRLVKEQGLYFDAAVHFMIFMMPDGTLIEVSPSAWIELDVPESPKGGVAGQFQDLHPANEQEAVSVFMHKLSEDRYAFFEAFVRGRDGEPRRVRWSLHYPLGARRVMVVGYDFSRDYALLSQLRVVQATVEASREAMIQAVLEDSEWHVVHANASTRVLLDLPHDLATIGPITRFFLHPEQVLPDLLHLPRGAGLYETRSWQGRTFEAEWSATRVDGEDGKTYVSCIIRDATERLKYEADLRYALEASEEARKFKDALFANVHHEVRTPLTVIRGYAELLQQLASEHTEPIEAILEQAQALERSLLLLLEAAHCSSQQPLPASAPKFLGETLQFRLQRFVRDGQKRGIAVDLTALDAVWDRTHTHAQILSRILELLLENALKFTEEGRVWVSVEQTTDLCKITVSDSGPGFPEGELDRVFDAFVQPQTGNTRIYGGMGLGLYVARCYAQGIGGHMGIENRTDGGADVWLLV